MSENRNRGHRRVRNRSLFTLLDDIDSVQRGHGARNRVRILLEDGHGRRSLSGELGDRDRAVDSDGNACWCRPGRYRSVRYSYKLSQLLQKVDEMVRDRRLRSQSLSDGQDTSFAQRGGYSDNHSRGYESHDGFVMTLLIE